MELYSRAVALFVAHCVSIYVEEAFVWHTPVCEIFQTSFFIMLIIHIHFLWRPSMAKKTHPLSRFLMSMSISYIQLFLNMGVRAFNFSRNSAETMHIPSHLAPELLVITHALKRKP